MSWPASGWPPASEAVLSGWIEATETMVREKNLFGEQEAALWRTAMRSAHQMYQESPLACLESGPGSPRRPGSAGSPKLGSGPKETRVRQQITSRPKPARSPTVRPSSPPQGDSATSRVLTSPSTASSLEPGGAVGHSLSWGELIDPSSPSTQHTGGVLITRERPREGPQESAESLSCPFPFLLGTLF